MRLKHGLWPAALLALFAVAGCGDDVNLNIFSEGYFAPQEPPPPPPCPRLALAEYADRLSRFNSDIRVSENLLYDVRIVQANGDCGYDENEIDVVMTVRIAVALGPAATEDNAPIRYFVAIARNSDHSVIARGSFDTLVEFPGVTKHSGTVEELEQIIPLKEGETGADYVILLGLEMTPEELAYNRSNPR
ncbi:MAG: hypothetical protein ACREEE_16235 [Dongiaceae bacterium]